MPYVASLSATETAQFTCLEEQRNVVNSIHFWQQNRVEIAMGKLFKLIELQFLHCKIRIMILVHRVVISTK